MVCVDVCSTTKSRTVGTDRVFLFFSRGTVADYIFKDPRSSHVRVSPTALISSDRMVSEEGSSVVLAQLAGQSEKHGALSMHGLLLLRNEDPAVLTTHRPTARPCGRASWRYCFSAGEGIL